MANQLYIAEEKMIKLIDYEQETIKLISKYKALVFDMDGTILNSNKAIFDSLGRLAEEYGFEITPEINRRCLGCRAEELMAGMGFESSKAEEMSLRWRVLIQDYLHEAWMFDGIEDVFKEDIPIGVVTSECREELEINMERMGIASRFDCTVTIDDTPYEKPHPEPLLHCIRQMGFTPEDVLYVGDTLYDIGSAKAAGVDFGLAGWGAVHTEGFEEADYVFSHPSEILEL